jgi:hypothetical protein
MKTQNFKNLKRICFAGNRLGEKERYTNEFLKLGFSKLNCFLHYLVKWALTFFFDKLETIILAGKMSENFQRFFRCNDLQHNDAQH